MTIKETISGGAITLVIAVVTWFLNDYSKLAEYKKLEEEKKAIKAEKKAVQIALNRMDSLYKIRERNEAIYKAHFDSTINLFKDYIQTDDSLTQEMIQIVTDSTSDIQVDSIYQELKKYRL